MSEVIVKLTDVSKSYNKSKVLDHFDLEINKGDFVIVTGESGCGKSTLLNIIGLLDKADSGTVEIFNETSIKPFSKKAEKILRDKIGYLFQNFALIENESVYDNLSFVLKIGLKKDKIYEALKTVHLEEYIDKKVYQCSGGEQQRIAIARLMLKKCELILADEPTGSLDEKNKNIVMELLCYLHDQGKTIIIVTHDKEIIHYGNKHINLMKL
jgi:ABC-type antimicrobial peptide transport system, ATPase component